MNLPKKTKDLHKKKKKKQQKQKKKNNKTLMKEIKDDIKKW